MMRVPKKGVDVATKYYINACRINYLIKNRLDNTQTISQFINKYNMDNNTSSRFDTLYDKDNNNLLKGLDTSVIKHPSLGEIKIEKDIIDFIEVEIDKATKKHGQDFKLKDEVYKTIKDNIVNYLKDRGEISMSKKVLALDLGNNNVKVALNGQAFSFVNKIERLDNAEALADNEYIKMNDDYFYYILGNVDSKFEKSASKKDKNFIPSLNYSAIRALVEAGEEVPSSLEVDIALLTPINQSSEKQEYIKKIKDNANNIVECRVDGKEYVVNIKINEVIPMLEGCSSAFLLDDLAGINTIVEVGSRTINIAKIVKNKFSFIECLEDMGSFNYYQALVAKINDRDITIDNIQDLIEVGLAEHDKDLLKAYLKKVLEETNKISKYRTNNCVYFCGGTIELFKSQGLNFEKGNIKIMENPVYSNVLGALKMMEAR